MAEPRAPLPSPSSPPNRLKVLWRVLLISNFALSVAGVVNSIGSHFLTVEDPKLERWRAYMFASVRKKDLSQMENDQAEKDLGELEQDVVEKHSGYETTEIPSTFMEDTSSIVTENILEDQQQEPFPSIHGWREKLGWSKK